MSEAASEITPLRLLATADAWGRHAMTKSNSTLRLSKADEPRFWTKIDCSGGPCSCWLWMAKAQVRGYGQFRLDGAARLAHRVAFVSAFGPIPDDLFVCHSCDTPACCNPSHLWLGTHLDNMRDSKKKQRNSCGDRHWARLYPELILRGDKHGMRIHKGAAARGERQHCAKLRSRDIPDIRGWHAIGVSMSKIAMAYGVNHNTISDVIKGITWLHVEGCV